MPLVMSQTVITQPCYGGIHERTCHLFIYAAPGATRRNWNEKSKSSSSDVSVLNGAHGKVWICALFNKLNRPISRGAARMRPKRPCQIFVNVLYQSQLFENKRKEQSDSRSVVFSPWPRFNSVTFCDWMRNYKTKACNFVNKVAS